MTSTSNLNPLVEKDFFYSKGNQTIENGKSNPSKKGQKIRKGPRWALLKRSIRPDIAFFSMNIFCFLSFFSLQDENVYKYFYEDVLQVNNRTYRHRKRENPFHFPWFLLTVGKSSHFFIRILPYMGLMS